MCEDQGCLVVINREAQLPDMDIQSWEKQISSFNSAFFIYIGLNNITYNIIAVMTLPHDMCNRKSSRTHFITWSFINLLHQL